MSQLYRPVIMMAINYRFVAVRSNWASVTQQRGKIMRKDLDVKPLQIQLVQELKTNDLTQRRIFAERALGKLAEDPIFYRKIVFSNEAHFWLNVYVNKQNGRFWSQDQPEELQKLPMHLEKVTGW